MSAKNPILCYLSDVKKLFKTTYSFAAMRGIEGSFLRSFNELICYSPETYWSLCTNFHLFSTIIRPLATYCHVVTSLLSSRSSIQLTSITVLV